MTTKLLRHCPDIVLVGTDIETTGLNGYFYLDRDVVLSNGKTFNQGERVHGALFHSILSAAFIVLDDKGNVRAKIHIGVRYNDDMILKMDSYVTNMHKENGLLDRLKTGEGFDIMVADTAELDRVSVEWLKKVGATKHKSNAKVEDKNEEGVIYFGNNISFDLEYFNAQCPEVYNHASFGSINVSSIRHLGKTSLGQKLNLPHIEKEKSHTALEDIHETHTELTAYLSALNF